MGNGALYGRKNKKMKYQLFWGMASIAYSQPLSQKIPTEIKGVYYLGFHMDCIKFKAPMCDYEEGINYNEDGNFEWMIIKDKKITSRELGRYEFKNDTVFHTHVAKYDFANAKCESGVDCKEIEEWKAKGDLIQEAFKKNMPDFKSRVLLQGDGTYKMEINRTKTAVYKKLK